MLNKEFFGGIRKGFLDTAANVLSKGKVEMSSSLFYGRDVLYFCGVSYASHRQNLGCGLCLYILGQENVLHSEEMCSVPCDAALY
jgi:hypothetical protein